MMEMLPVKLDGTTQRNWWRVKLQWKTVFHGTEICTILTVISHD